MKIYTLLEENKRKTLWPCVGERVLRYDCKSTIYKRESLLGVIKILNFYFKKHHYKNKKQATDYRKCLQSIYLFDKELIFRIYKRTLTTE